MSGPGRGGVAIALATHAGLPALNDDDCLLVEALARRGVSAVPAVWDAPDVRWEGFTAVMVRSCWDYHCRLAEFLGGIAKLEGLGGAIWNPPPVLRWNSHKSYLRDLAAAGVATVPTRWVARGEQAALADILDVAGWREAVVKPAVSASALGTWRTTVVTAACDQTRFDELLATGDVMVQPYIDVVRDQGEWSLMFWGRRYSHSVLKRPAGADFRVQWEYGGSAVAKKPPRSVREDAERALAVVPPETLYARVDGVEREGRLVVMELELIEPHLFLGWEPSAPDRLAQALLRIAR